MQRRDHQGTAIMSPHESVAGTLGIDLELDTGFVYAIQCTGDFQMGLKKLIGDTLALTNAVTFVAGEIYYIDTRNYGVLVTAGTGAIKAQKCSFSF